MQGQSKPKLLQNQRPRAASGLEHRLIDYLGFHVLLKKNPHALLKSRKFEAYSLNGDKGQIIQKLLLRL
jgi:hypothetical protein